MQAQPGESARDAGHLAVEFAPGEAHALVAHDQGFAIGKFPGGLGESLREGQLRRGTAAPRR